MPSSLVSGDDLVPAESIHWLPLSPHPSCGPIYHRPGHRSSRKGQSTTGLPRRFQGHRTAMRSPPGDVTDLALSTEYSSSPIAWADPVTPMGSPYNTAGYRLPSPETTNSVPRTQNFLKGGSPKRVRWSDLEEEVYAYSTPPMTPHIGRLKTPELEPMKVCSRFCDCDQYEKSYQEGRAKMDSQRR